MFNFGTNELILILVIALVVFGPGKLPDVGKAIGKSIKEFKGAVNGTDKQEESPAAQSAKQTTPIDLTADIETGNSHKEKE